MKISNAEEYALRAVVFLGKHASEDRTFSLTEISQAEKLPLPFLEQLFRPLRSAKLVESKRGAGGGYRLTGDPAKVSVYDVFRAVSGEIRLQDCTTEYCNCEQGDCKILPLWEKLEKRVIDTLKETTVKELAG